MNFGELISIKTLGDEKDFFGTTEKHTPYRAEIKLLSCVQQGDVNKLMTELKGIDSLIIAGKMSANGVMQYKYMAVSVLTLATRYAIQGGLDEKTAYSFSDRVIMLVDSLDSQMDILNCVANEIVDLTKLVSKNRKEPVHSPHVRKCIRYINDNIRKKLTVTELSGFCGISSDYLSQIFKNEIGETLSSYISHKKLELAKQLIMQGKSNQYICECLGFSSQSHFITVFKKNFGMTPTQYRKLTK